MLIITFHNSRLEKYSIFIKISSPFILSKLNLTTTYNFKTYMIAKKRGRPTKNNTSTYTQEPEVRAQIPNEVNK
jgi:hypothetical protein